MKKNSFFLLLILLVVGCHSSDYYYEKGIDLMDNEMYDKAIEMFDKSIKKDINNLAAYNGRGTAKSMLNDDAGAINDFSFVIHNDSTYIIAWYNRGITNAYLKKYNDAINDYNKAILLKTRKNIEGEGNVIFDMPGLVKDVDYVKIISNRALSYQQIDSLQQAFADYSYCIKKNYRLMYSYFGRGLIYLCYKEKDNAHIDFINALKYAKQSDEEPEVLENLKKILLSEYGEAY